MAAWVNIDRCGRDLCPAIPGVLPGDPGSYLLLTIERIPPRTVSRDGRLAETHATNERCGGSGFSAVCRQFVSLDSTVMRKIGVARHAAPPPAKVGWVGR